MDWMNDEVYKRFDYIIFGNPNDQRERYFLINLNNGSSKLIYCRIRDLAGKLREIGIEEIKGFEEI